MVQRVVATAALLGVALAGLAGCSGGAGTTASSGSSTPSAGPSQTSVASGISSANPCGATTAVPATYRHVIWIWMENKEYPEVIGNADAPYETNLAHKCATAPGYADASSQYNSLSNYVAATSGLESCSGGSCPTGTVTTWDDCAPSTTCQAPVDNLFRQVRAAGGTAMSFEEAMTSNCQLTAAGTYGPKHNPAAYYTGGNDRSACLTDDVPMGTTTNGAFHDALATNSSLPTFSFVTPDLCHDTHDCSVSTGDAWLAMWLPQILDSPAYRSGDTAIMVVHDEDTPCPNVFIAPTIATGTTSTLAGLGHFAMLRTTEQMLGIHKFLGAAATAPSFRSVYRF